MRGEKLKATSFKPRTDDLQDVFHQVSAAIVYQAVSMLMRCFIDP